LAGNDSSDCWSTSSHFFGGSRISFGPAGRTGVGTPSPFSALSGVGIGSSRAGCSRFSFVAVIAPPFTAITRLTGAWFRQAAGHGGGHLGVGAGFGLASAYSITAQAKRSPASPEGWLS